jgi:ribosomal protein L7/L12
MRPLTIEERDQVLFALRTGSDVAAIKRYRELTGADLYTATMTVKAMQRELGR